MIQSFLDSLGIPDKCFLNKPLFKKLFQESGELDITDKKALKDDIDKIRWLYTLKTSTINIEPYVDGEREYDELAILQVDLSNTSRLKRIAVFVNKAIPYPLVLVFTHGDNFALSVADKRLSQSDKSKWVTQDGWTTDWINLVSPSEGEKQFMEDMRLKNLSSLNFYSFYQDIKSRVIALNSASRSGAYEVTTQEGTEDRLEQLTKIDLLEKEIAELRVSLKKETQFNRKLALNVSVKERLEAIATLEEKL
jgi:hypothetical protein